MLLTDYQVFLKLRAALLRSNTTEELPHKWQHIWKIFQPIIFAWSRYRLPHIEECATTTATTTQKGHPQRSCHQKQPKRTPDNGAIMEHCKWPIADADGCEATITQAQAGTAGERQCRQVCVCLVAAPYVAAASPALGWDWDWDWIAPKSANNLQRLSRGRRTVGEKRKQIVRNDLTTGRQQICRVCA